MKAKVSSKSGKIPSHLEKEIVFPDMGEEEDHFEEATELTEEDILKSLRKWFL